MIAVYVTLGAFLLSLCFVAFVLYVSRKRSWFDHHDERKIHTGQVPRLGGIGFATAFVIVTAATMAIDQVPSLGPRLIPVLFAFPLVLAFGVVDDFRSLRPRYKLLVQSGAAIIVMAAGFTFRSIDFSTMGFNLDLGLFRFPLTFLWIVGITNALNFIDGVDGLAGGVSALAALGYAAIFAAAGNEKTAILCLALAAAVGGFLVFNAPFPKARIFMGDGGSQFLGFTLALLPLLDDGVGQAILPLPFAAAILLIPGLDMLAAIWRRTRDGRRIDSPDKAHMHHKLMSLGLGALGVDALFWGLQVMLGVLVFISRKSAGVMALAFLLTAYILACAFFIVIHYLNRAEIARSARTKS